MTEHEVEFTSDNYTLAGTFVSPAESKPLPAVLMLPGSGQTNRDDNAQKLAINVFPQMAEALSNLGFASLRYDKRGAGASQGDYWRSGFTDRITDARGAVEWLRSQPNVDPRHIYVLGHSEGALVATSLAAGNTTLAGIILLGGSSKTGEETMLWQGQQIVAGLTGFSKWFVGHLHIDPLKKQRQQIERIKTSPEDTFRVQMVQRINARWMREFFVYDPEKDFAKIHIPVLAITGSKDIQVDAADLERMKQLTKGPFESHDVPDVTHMLRTDSGAPSIRAYKEQVTRPIDERIMKYIQTWLREQAYGKNQQTRR
ncbi:MAG TPA: alpha/beta fold hydrolase [Patescibacteria group bacterium]|nr:alpha/beta fold hydrolase [Patescibacteria group bacterium]